MPHIIENARPAPLLRQLAAMLYDSFLLAACWIGVGFIFLIISKGQAITGGVLLLALRLALLAAWIGFYVYSGANRGRRSVCAPGVSPSPTKTAMPSAANVHCCAGAAP